jgi:hypothetical protein
MNKVIAVDFDGTVVTHEYPEVGVNVPFAYAVLKRLVDQDVKIILWTMRSGEHLDAAVEWFKSAGIPLWGVNQNPEQSTWTNSPKAYAQAYIDDAAIGCPLRHRLDGKRPMVDWKLVEEQLEESGWLTSTSGGADMRSSTTQT